MNPKLDHQFIQYFESFVRQIVRDEQKILLSEHTSFKGAITQINYSKESILIIVSSKIGWLKGDNTLQLFYTLLISHGFITCDIETFKIHFIGNNGAIEYIKWNTQITRLVYLFNQLILYNFIPENNTPHQLLTKHFINNEGKKLSNGTLRTSLNNVMNKKKSSETIDNIIKELLKNST